MNAVLLRLISFVLITFLQFSDAIVSNIEAQNDGRNLNLSQSKNGNKSQPSRYHALVIGINDYQYVEHLETAVNDAKEIERMLRGSFGFQTKLLLNAKRVEIINALNDYQRTLDETTSLLIYYAGHGYRDRKVDKAYWLPADAQKDYRTNWISADDITTNIKGIDAKHILIIADSCYSGMMTRESGAELTPQEKERVLQRLMEEKSRILIASGGNEPVIDGGCGGHSLFACALLRGLEKMGESAFTAGDLFYKYIREPVAGKSDQMPQYMVILNSGHESGDFIFFRKSINQPSELAAAESAFWEGIKDSTNPADFREYIVRFPKGNNVEKARSRFDELTELAYWNSIATSAKSNVFQVYLEKYPNGKYKGLAVARLYELREQEYWDSIADSKNPEPFKEYLRTDVTQ